MPALNRVELIGRLGRDPEERYTATGRRLTRFPVAVNRTWKTVEGETQEATDWFQVEAWGRLGEVCQQYLTKGRLVYIEGRLRTDRWEDAEGQTHYRTVVVARQMQMLDRKPSEEEIVAESEPGEEG
jgi:single-strand DNA-binding protein